MGVGDSRASSNHDPDTGSCEPAQIGDSPAPKAPAAQSSKSAPRAASAATAFSFLPDLDAKEEMQVPDESAGMNARDAFDRATDNDHPIFADRASRTRSTTRAPDGAWEPNGGGAELARTISQLAAANQQLAAAHRLALEHCHALLEESTRTTDTPRPSKLQSPSSRLLATNKKSKKLTRKLTEVNNDDSGELRMEVERLKASQSRSRKANEEMVRDLEQQRLLVERLMRDFKDSQRECERKDESLKLARAELSRSELERARLLARLETFQCERSRQEEEEATRTRQLRSLEEQTREISEETCGANCSSSSSSSSSSNSEANEQFRKELALKREARQRAIAKISSDMEGVRSELEAERLAHSETARLLESLRLQQEGCSSSKDEEEARGREHVEVLRLLDLLKVSDEVSLNLRLQLERTDDLRFQLESDPEEHKQRIAALRRLADEGRDSLRERRRQTAGLKDRLAQLLTRLAEAPRLRLLADSDEIRREAESQLGDIARARQLCDERSRVLIELREQCSRQLGELRVKNASLGQENQSLEEELRKIEDKVDTQDSEILNLESQLGLAKADCRDLQNQMSLINSLFSQMLLGASSLDLDRLTRLLQENHDLITGMAKEKGTEAAALPKLLLDIVEQVDGGGREACDDGRKGEDELQEESIAHNLPKVWRILLELLSCHQASGPSEAASLLSESSPDSCYKSVDTPTGPRLVISVSKTYIRLKELILEKKHLEKEMNRMKQLNSHLETKLSEQEQRLSTVSSELSKTWNVVGRMQAQHQQLHTHEKILRYELQQKRKMLQELKQELEYCREKWESARQKNTNTEIEWKSLRREFAARKALVSHASAFSNSGESGFSDEREEESDEEDERDLIGKRVRSRRRSKKDGARVMSPDTESEQPTDTEFSESKVTSPSTTSGQQTPALAEVEAAQQTAEESPSSDTTAAVADPTTTDAAETSLDPLDKALAKVIENLLETDPVAATSGDREECTPPESTKGAASSIVFSIGPIPAKPAAAAASGEVPQFGSLPREEEQQHRTTTLDARAARLKSLEEQAEWLVRKVNDTNRRGSALSSRLEELHEAYGSAPAAPPMPDVLPAFRLRSELMDGAAATAEAEDTPREPHTSDVD